MARQQKRMDNKSGKIMDIVDQINGALEDVKGIEEQQGLLVDVLSQVKCSVDELKEMKKQKEVERRNQQALAEALKSFIANLEILDAYTRELQKVDPSSDLVGAIQTYSLVANFMRDNKDYPLKEMQAYSKRVEVINQLVKDTESQVQGGMSAIFTEFSI